MNFKKFVKIEECIKEFPKSKILSSQGNNYGRYKLYLSGTKHTRTDVPMLDQESIVMGDGGEATVFFASGKYSFSSHNFAFTSNDKNLTNQYLFRLIEFILPELNYAGFVGSGLKNIDKKFFKKIEIEIISVNEQNKIKNVLDSIDSVIKKIQLKINKLKYLKTSLMNELLTKGIKQENFKDSELGKIPEHWETLKVSKLLNFKNGLNKEKSAFGKGNPIVNYMDVFSNPVINSHNIFGKVLLKEDEINRFKVNTGDIFFTRTSETVEEIGISSVIIETANKTTFSGFILRGRPKTKLLYSSLSGYFFRTNYVREQIKKTCSHTTRALTNGSLLGDVTVMLPTLDEQRMIFKILNNIENLILKTTNSMEKYFFLKKSVMQNQLSGKVRMPIN